VVSIQHRSKQGFDPVPTREPWAGLGGSKPSMSEATSNVRSIPKIKGQWATGRLLLTATAMMLLLAGPAQAAS